jgi:hypothetical protein
MAWPAGSVFIWEAKAFRKVRKGTAKDRHDKIGIGASLSRFIP